MKAKLYVLRGAHPSRSAMLMLDHKGIDYDTVTLPAGFQPYLIRFLGFRPRPGFSRQVDGETPRMLRKADRMGTVPALRLGDRRMTTNHDIPVPGRAPGGAAPLAHRSRAPSGSRGSRALGRRGLSDGG